MVLFAQAAVTPTGNPIGVKIPATPVVVCLILVVNGVFKHNVGVLDAWLTAMFGFTVIVPVAFTVPQPPVNGIL